MKKSKSYCLFRIAYHLSLGQTLLEVVLAVGVMALITTSLVIFSSKSVANSVYTKNKILANQYAKELSEWLKSERDTSFAIFSARFPASPTTKTFCFPTLPSDWTVEAKCEDIVDPDPLPYIDGAPPFFRQAEFTNIEEVGKTYVSAKIKIIWTDSTRHEVNTEINLADWK